MNRRSTATLTAAALLVAGTAAVAETGAGMSADAQASTTSTTYVGHDIAGNFAMADIADPKGQGPDIGDLMAFTQRLTRHGRTVGRVSNVAVGVDHQRNLFQSTGTMSLAHGKVTFSGLVSQTPSFVLAVTGGTGRYRGADGTVTFALKGNRQLLTLTLAR
jgi:hypothetical protein